MTLTPWEQNELEGLLWRAQHGGLHPNDEQRMRHLIAQQNPQAANLPVAELVTAGLVVIGAIAFLKWLSKD